MFFQNIGKLALSEAELKKISLPVKLAVGDRDPVNRLYVQPLERVRNDWPVVEIKDAGHINCVVKEQFRNEIVNWVKANRVTSSPRSDRVPHRRPRAGGPSGSCPRRRRRSASEPSRQTST